MKTFFILLVLCLFWDLSYSQEIPGLPIPMGAGTVEVWNDSIYHFGGSNNWAGSVVYPRIYRFDYLTWAYYDSIPDYNLWDVESVLVGDEVFLISGWPAGPQLLRKYNLATKNWTYLAESPNTSQTWGVAAEHLDGKIYLFLSNGSVFEYTISSNSWDTKTSNTIEGTWDLSSILYNNEIYIIGFDDSTFFKYTPAVDTWTPLAKSPYHVGACAMGIINDLIYCIGGNTGGERGADYKSILVYNITTDSWDMDTREISGRRHWMATAEYRGGLYIIGGLDSISYAVDTVEEIVPQGTAGIIKNDQTAVIDRYLLEQNYPNPFNSRTTIKYIVGSNGHSPIYVDLSIFNILGQKICMLVSEKQHAGYHQIEWDASQVNSGVYFYRLEAEGYIDVKKMIVIK